MTSCVGLISGGLLKSWTRIVFVYTGGLPVWFNDTELHCSSLITCNWRR